ncbi:MAG: Penicillin-binding protein 1A [Gammaproteobacteria bacterium]|nr:Penicillin-binding protein 1A [Gammaproteobacteria bacterium]
MKIFLRVAGFFLIIGLVGALAVVGLVFTVLPDLPDAEEIRDVRLQVPLRVYARNGELIAEFGEQHREPVNIDDVPETLIHALLAAEDDSFYSHPGVDFAGVIRAAIENFKSGQTEQGASTITMQVARNYFLTREKTYTRKIKEALLAFRLERILSKAQILELYLNKIFLGHRSYGFAAAARLYYAKSLDEITLPESAMLAGLPKAPSRDNPLRNEDRALKRRNYVLSRMRRLDYIDEANYAAATKAPLTAERHRISTDVNAPYVAEMVRDYMVDQYGEEAYWLGYKVYTTVVPELQHSANDALRAGLLDYSRRHGYRGPVASIDLPRDTVSEALNESLGEYPVSGELVPAVVVAIEGQSASVYTRKKEIVEIPWEGLAWARRFATATSRGPKPQKASDVVKTGDIVYVRPDGDSNWRLSQLPEVEGGLVSLDPNDGAILSLTGGFDFYLGKFNRIIQAERQPGSNIKPFIFSAALERGFTPASRVSGAPIVVDDRNRDAIWRPENYSGKFFGPTRLRMALTKSMNLVSVRVVRSMGLEHTRNHLARFGFDPDLLPNGLSLALGSGTVPPMTVARAYAVLANGGFLVEPYFIKWIEDPDGNIIEQAKPSLACDYCSTPAFEMQREQPLQARRAIPVDNRFLVTSMMRDVIQHGTGRRALKLGRGDLAGKTGTTNDFRDAWFSGFNDAVVTTVWVGFDDSRTLGRGEAGSRAALPIWVDYMDKALEGIPESPLPKPDNVVAIRISPDSGKAVPDDEPAGITEYFKLGTEPNTAKRSSRTPSSYSDSKTERTDPGTTTEGLF